MRLKLFFLFTLVYSLSLGQRTYYISSSGNDGNNGLSSSTPWKTLRSYYAGNTYLFKRGDVFYFSIPTLPDPASKTTISAYGVGEKPLFSLYSKINQTAWVRETDRIWKIPMTIRENFTGSLPQNANVGFLKLDGRIYGNKVSSLDQLKKQWDFFSDNTSLYIYSSYPPSKVNSFLFSNYGNGINLSNNFNISNIKIEGCGSHAMQGVNIKDVEIKNIEINDIGGSYLPGFADGKVRYGNGIELWNGSSDCKVENCIVRNVYDAAYTMQGIGNTVYFYNTIFKNNKADKNEQSFEAWAKGEAIGFKKCYIINNECLNAGYGWSHTVRPDKNQAVHLLSYTVEAAQTDLTFENNIFYRAKSGLYFHKTNEPLPNFLSRNNKINLDPSTPIRALFSNSTIENYELFVNSAGKEKGSAFSLIDINILPVTLKSFDIKRTLSKTLEISWEVAKDQFEKETIIERSIGNKNSFVPIAKITFESAIHSYYLPDTVGNVSYFRLKQLDVDNHSTYSNVVVVPVARGRTSLNIYPNPVHYELRLILMASRREEGILEICSMSGLRMLSQSLSLQQGSNSIILEISSIPKGSYIVKLSKKGMTESFGSFLKL
jgi:hypothetical protein